MEDARIVDLYLQRNEDAIRQTKLKYNSYCNAIAYGILNSSEEAEECVNDAYLGVWNAIPPHRPKLLSAFIGKITRRISLNRWRSNNAKKRGQGNVSVSVDELEECIPSGFSIDEKLEAEEIAYVLNSFLDGIAKEERNVFICRYWYFDSINEIANRFGFGESKVKMMLKRSRDKLTQRLREEDIVI